jgi:hypothetical protein
MALLGFCYAILAIFISLALGVQQGTWLYDHFVLGETFLIGIPAVVSLLFRRWRLIAAGVLIPSGVFLLLNSITCFP